MTGIRAAELATPAAEAQAIALAIRETIESPGRTAALVTLTTRDVRAVADDDLVSVRTCRRSA